MRGSPQRCVTVGRISWSMTGALKRDYRWGGARCATSTTRIPARAHCRTSASTPSRLHSCKTSVTVQNTRVHSFGTPYWVRQHSHKALYSVAVRGRTAVPPRRSRRVHGWNHTAESAQRRGHCNHTASAGTRCVTGQLCLIKQGARNSSFERTRASRATFVAHPQGARHR